MRTAAAYAANLLLGLALVSGTAICGADPVDRAATVLDKPSPAVPTRYIVQAATVSVARERVARAGGEVRQELAVINGVSAMLSTAQVTRLRADTSLRLFADRALETFALFPVFTDGTALTFKPKSFEANYPMLVGADTLQSGGINGQGVTIAILDSGFWYDAKDDVKGRILASIDVVNGGTNPVTADPFGHGSHITSIAAGSFGIAPKANVVIVRAFNANGVGNYSDVIAGLGWIVANRQKYNIRVLNLSFGAPPQSNYWDDPLNQAVMAAWRAGIVVVTAAGNEGPTPMTIGVPGNVPYVVTVGAQTDNYTPYDPTDDRLASFSSTGPTLEGFIKPEVVAPGGHLVGSMSYQSYLANIDPGSMNKDQLLFTMSGTSQAAAVTSGVVALMIQADPTLTPDLVKCRLIASASPAISSTGVLAYSVFQQGAGLINATNALSSAASGCANQGLNIADDLAGVRHFGGPANQDAAGNYYVMDMAGSTWGRTLSGDGYTWSRGYTWSKGFTWTSRYTWSSGYTWSRGYTWSKGYTWSRGYTWSTGYTWSRTLPWWGTTGVAQSAAKSASVSSWVPNE